MNKVVNLNADMGEGFGAYAIGHDEALIRIVRSANIACGFHGGDATTMHRLCLLASKQGCSIGAHPGFNDLWGFGRRQIRMRASDLEYMMAYQIGALQGMAAYAGVKVTHLKAHGALSNMAAHDEGYAMAIGKAIKAVDASLIYVALPGTELEKAASRLGLRCAREGFCDRLYDDSGNLASRTIPGTVLSDPAKAVEHTLRMVLEGEVLTMSGKRLPLPVDTMCVHGDEPTAVAVATAVRDALVAAGVDIVPLTEMKL